MPAHLRKLLFKRPWMPKRWSLSRAKGSTTGTNACLTNCMTVADCFGELEKTAKSAGLPDEAIHDIQFMIAHAMDRKTVCFFPN